MKRCQSEHNPAEKYNLELEYTIWQGVDITENEIRKIIDEANSIIKNKGTDPEKLLWAYVKKGQAIQKSGDIDIIKSKRPFEKALKLCCDMPEALLGMGNIYADFYSTCHDEEKALACYNRVLQIKPDYAAAYLKRAQLYRFDDDRCIADCTAAIQLKRDYAEAFKKRAAAYWELGEYDRAIDDYTEAIHLMPNWSTPYEERGNIYCDHKGDYDRAIADFTKAIQIIPEVYRTYRYRGIAYEKKGERDKALADFLQARSEGWKEGDEYRLGKGNTAETYASDCDESHLEEKEVNSDRQNEEFQKALSDYDSILSANPLDTDCRKKRAELYVQLKSYDEAIADYSRAIEDYSELIRLAEIANEWNKSRSYEMRLSSAYYTRGEVWCYKGKTDKAIDDFSEAIYLDLKEGCGGLAVFINRGQLYAEKGEYDKAIADITRGFRFYFPWELIPYAFAYRGSWYNKIGNYTKAIKDCNEAIRTKPDFSDAYCYRGEAYIGKHQYKKAIDDLNEALRLDNQNTLAYNLRDEAYRLSRAGLESGAKFAVDF